MLFSPTKNTTSQPCRNLPVYTTKNRYLGRVIDVEVDPTGRYVVVYQVATPWWIGGLWRKSLIISSKQVVKITLQYMVVEELDVSALEVSPGLVPE